MHYPVRQSRRILQYSFPFAATDSSVIAISPPAVRSISAVFRFSCAPRGEAAHALCRALCCVLQGFAIGGQVGPASAVVKCIYQTLRAAVLWVVEKAKGVFSRENFKQLGKQFEEGIQKGIESAVRPQEDAGPHCVVAIAA